MRTSFTRKERRMVESLQEMGYNKGLAHVLVYFSCRENGRCKDIQVVTDLRQPEVSMALKAMKENGWVDVKMMKVSPKGRPINDYILKRPFDHIVSEIAEREARDLEKRRALIDGLLKQAK